MSYQFIGTAEWTKQSHGRINIKDRIKLTRQAFLPSLIKVVKSQLSIGKEVELKLEQIPLPDTSAVASAIDELHSSANAAIINHSLRTYFWGAALGIINNVEYDPEFFAVGCILHDLGTTEKCHGKHENCHCFTVDGAIAAEAWANTFGSHGRAS